MSSTLYYKLGYYCSERVNYIATHILICDFSTQFFLCLARFLFFLLRLELFRKKSTKTPLKLDNPTPFRTLLLSKNLEMASFIYLFLSSVICNRYSRLLYNTHAHTNRMRVGHFLKRRWIFIIND